jgi:hypothetical protein
MMIPCRNLVHSMTPQCDCAINCKQFLGYSKDNCNNTNLCPFFFKEEKRISIKEFITFFIQLA